jgi:hypothetical protein
MAKKKDNTTLLLLLAAAGAGIYYFYSKNSAAAPATSAVPPAPGALVQSPGPAVYSTAPTPAANVNSATVVQGWFATLDAANKQQAYYQFANMTADEVNEMADIIVNVWGTGAKPSAAQTQFWNMWRAKYHVLDGTYA